MNRTDLLDHPDLRTIWDALESAAPMVEWTEIPESAPTHASKMRGRIPYRKAAALVAVFALVAFSGIETAGVLAARRALADSSAVTGEFIELDLVTLDIQEPWATAKLADLSVTDFGIFGHTVAADGTTNQWLLSATAWTSLGLDASNITAVEDWNGTVYFVGRTSAGELDDTAVIWRVDPTSEVPVPVFSLPGGHIASLMSVDDHIVAAGYEQLGLPRVWTSPDGETWNATSSEPSDRSVFNAGTSYQGSGVMVGYEDASLPLVEVRDVAIWRVQPAGSLSTIPIPDLRSLGVGYNIGGFRLPDGLKGVVAGKARLIAYTGYLQVWDGFQGLTLEPREGWATLILRSQDGSEWTPHVLTGFAIYQMVPFGDGFLAAAALTPTSDTDVAEVGEVTTEVASAAVNKLYYSADGLAWQEIKGSPEFGKPLLAITAKGGVLAVDEYAVEDPSSAATTLYEIMPGS